MSISRHRSDQPMLAARFSESIRKIQPRRLGVRFWGRVDVFEEKVFRVVTLADETTIHNAFPDRRFKE